MVISKPMCCSSPNILSDNPYKKGFGELAYEMVMMFARKVDKLEYYFSTETYLIVIKTK